MKLPLKPNLDKLGICTSTFCAIHCLITPLLIFLLPLAGLTFLQAEGFEIGILTLSLFFAVTSLVVSYFKKHKNATPILLAIIGFAFFALGKSFSIELLEIVLSLIGGAFVITAHYRNRVLSLKSISR